MNDSIVGVLILLGAFLACVGSVCLGFAVGYATVEIVVIAVRRIIKWRRK